MPLDLRQALSKHFSYPDFLSGQKEVVQQILAGEDLCVVMPTGAGKSLCYQLPAILKPGYTIVISPLISLMKDQVDALKERQIPAAFINSTLSLKERKQVIDEVQHQRIKLLYIAPERLRAKEFRTLIHSVSPGLLIVDEAHCISQWGHDFRPDYTRIGQFVDEANISQVCAFTATATEVVRNDIMQQLHRLDMKPFVTGFKRPNLSFSVQNCHSISAKLNAVKEILKDPKPSIIYTARRKNVDLLKEELDCLAYHAGLSDMERTDVQNQFMQSDCPVIVATNAFGMGIDRPDIRRVIHYDTPGSLEAYYQEAGRAGRDAKPADCILLYNYSDRRIHEFFIKMNHPPQHLVYQIYQVLHSLSKNGTLQVAMSQNELAQTIQAIREQQISPALKILEQHQYIKRGFRQDNQGQLRVLISPDQLQDEHGEGKTQRSLFLQKLHRNFAQELWHGRLFSYSELSSLTGFSDEQIKRILYSLNGTAIQWIPPFLGRAITLTQAMVTDPEIDFSQQQQHLNIEQQRLNDMFRYPKTINCRQQFLVHHFGETSTEWSCRNCDNCQHKESIQLRTPTEREWMILCKILNAVIELKSRYGVQRTAQFLVGSRSSDIRKWNLHHYPSYGVLNTWRQSQLIKLLNSLISLNCLHIVGDSRYPRLAISSLGRSVLDRKAEIAIDPTVFTEDTR